MSTSSRRRESLAQKMMSRYLAVPDVAAWLLDRQPSQITNSVPFEMPLAYACMYYPPTYIPDGAERYPLPKPFLDIGDVLLCHHRYEGIAVGTLHMKNEQHALTAVRDAVIPSHCPLSKKPLSKKPRTRNFAVDLTVKQLEVVEFAWMDDDSLIIACRRLVESPTAEGRLFFSADFLFFDPIPPNCSPEKKFLHLRTRLEERNVVCDFCDAQGYASCECPDSMKRQPPISPSNYTQSDAIVPGKDHRNEPILPCTGSIGSWQNYASAVLRSSQTGSFFVDSIARADNGNMIQLPRPKQPIQYRFVCGNQNDTFNLVSLYCQKANISLRALISDTFLYGNGLSQGSHIGMLMDKHDDTSLQSDVFQAHDYNPAVNSYSHDDYILPVDVSNQVTTDTVPSQTTLSNDTLLASEYSRPYSTYGVDPQVIPDQSQCTEEGSLFTTRSNEDSPSSVLLGRGESWISRWGDISALPLDGLRHPMNIASNEWTEPDQDAEPINNDQPPPQPRPLSTSNRAIQECMTVNASGTPTCRRCGASFPKRGNLSRHIQTVHLKLKPFVCKHCPSRFGYNAHLKRHNKSVHQRSRTFRA